MCGRVIQSSGPLRYGLVEGMDARDSRVHNYPPRWNAAPSQDLLVIRRNHQTGQVSLDPLRWGLIPYWCEDPKGGRKPINAKCETVATLPTFRDAYRRRRCIVPVDGFFEWKAIKGQKTKQPFAIAVKDGSPFGRRLDTYLRDHHNYVRWLGEEENPRDLMRPFPANRMRMWPISTRVNKPENDDPSIIEPIELSTSAA
jgi:putative SOS response-associated peptidase YedK